MLTQALTASTDMFKENVRVLALIEDKAQKAASLAGLFLAAGFSFLRRETIRDFFLASGWTGLVFLWVTILFMLACLVACAGTLKVRPMLTPPAPEDILTKVDQRLAANDDVKLSERQERNLREQAVAWHRALKAQDIAVADKAKLLRVTQLFLLTGLALVAALLILSAYAYGINPQAPPRKPN